MRRTKDRGEANGGQSWEAAMRRGLWKEWPPEQAGGRGGSGELVIAEVRVSADDRKWTWPGDWLV